jgi:pimeloyl-ACP methyl ester carboxylesterase
MNYSGGFLVGSKIESKASVIRLFVLVLLLLGLGFSGPQFGLLPPSPAAANDSLERPRKVIVLQGFLSSSECTDNPETGLDERMVGRVAWLQETLQGLREEGQEVPQYIQYADQDFFYFDYGAGYCPDISTTPADESKNPHYSPFATCTSGVVRSSDTLDLMVSRILQDSGPETQIDIVAHSMGGIIAAYWVATHGDDPRLKNIHSVTTFDSPLQGIEARKINALKFRASVICNDDTTAIDDMFEGGPVIGTIISNRPAALVPLVTIRAVGGGLVLPRGDSVGNVVTDSKATLPGRWRDLYDFMGSHSALWNNPVPAALQLLGFAASTQLHDDQDLPAGSFSPGWKDEAPSLPMYIKEKAKRGNLAGDPSITFDFWGSGISLVFFNCYEADQQGTAQVQITSPDGSLIKNGSIPKTCAGPAATSRREFSDLGNGHHRLDLTVTGGGPFSFDAFEVQPDQLPGVTAPGARYRRE